MGLEDTLRKILDGAVQRGIIEEGFSISTDDKQHITVNCKALDSIEFIRFKIQLEEALEDDNTTREN